MPPKFTTLDVRPILQSGGDPFQAIMRAVDSLADGGGLRLLAPCRPVPLLTVMAHRGYGYEMERTPDGDFEVRFMSREASEIRQLEGIVSVDQWPEPAIVLDLTDLDPAEQSVRVMAAVRELKSGDVVSAILSHEPSALYPQLCRRSHLWVCHPDGGAERHRITIRVGGEVCKPNGVKA